MATKSFHDPLLKSNFASPFLTTRRNETLDLLANLVILPAYTLCVDNIISAAIKFFALPSFLHIIIWSLALIPLVGILGANVIWRLGFKGRKRAFAISLALIISLLFINTERTIYLFVITTSIIALEFLVKRLIARRKLKSASINFPILFLTIFVLGVGCLLYYWTYNFSIFSLYINTIKALVVVFLFVSIPLPLILGFQDSWDSYIEERRHKRVSVALFLIRIFSRVFLYTILAATLILSNDQVKASMLALSLMALTSGVADLLSRQKANFRNIFKTFERDYIYRLISPTTSPANFLLVFFQKARWFLQKNLIWIFFLSAFIVGGFLLPGFLYWRNPDVDIWKLFSVATLGSFLLALLIIGFMIIQIRARHIVIPFTSVRIGDDAELDIAANIMTHAFVEQLREITVLLNLRQVENLSLRSERGLAVFVTSGLDQDFIDQVRSLGNIETSDIKMPFGNIISLLIQQLAETQVRGTVKRQDDNSIAVWVEFSKRGGRSFGVDLVILPDEANHEINNDQIIKMANILAVKLVAKLGFHSHLATSWESMHLFLEGLNAAYHRNWWQAIENYQKAVHIEGVTRNSFGYGYYHLGAVLMSQGEISKGMKYLQHAESSGPPLAETQYMLALGLFLQNRDQLNNDRTIFTDIEWRCKTAIKMRPDFPEAHHLLGTAYYQRGRLREREWTSKSLLNNDAKRTKKSDPISKHYEDDYEKASHHLRKSIKAYDHAIRRLPNDAQMQSTIFDEQSRLVQDRMAATHRLADALRCLKLYAEADSYYREVLVAYPRNNRTLVDLAKTYTLAKNWGRADEFLRGDVFNHTELYWNKSACFYMGWSQLGGLSETSNPVKRVIDTLIRGYESIANWNQTSTKISKEKIFWNAVCWLDYAIHQYPGYLYVWRQMNWLDTFKKVAKRFRGTMSGVKNIEDVYQLNIGKSEDYVPILKLWMAWRIRGNVYQNDHDLSKLAHLVADDFFTNENKDVFPNAHFGQHYKAMKEIRAKYASLHEEDNIKHSIKSTRRRRESLLLGEISYNAWKKSTETFDTLLKKDDNIITFGDHWSIDIFADLSLITIKILIEGKAYEYAEQVAECSARLLSQMKKRCDNVCTDLEMLPLGGKVATYQLSMLYAWRAYAMLMIIDDVATLARLNHRKTNLDEIQILIDQSKNLVEHNPLTNFSQALLYKHLGFLRQAADELNQLATLVAPFDPHKYIIRDLGKTDYTLQADEVIQPDSPARLYQKERIHGRRQFDTIVNLANIHHTLASVHALLEEYNIVSLHINTAIGNSPYQDITAELFLNLAITLNRQEKYEEALTAAEKAMELNPHLSRFHYKSAKTFEPFVLECVLLTNSERYSNALEKAYQVIESVDYKNSIERHLNTLDELKKEYSELEQVVMHLHSFETKLKKAVKLYESNKKSVVKKGERYLYTEITDLCLRDDKLSRIMNQNQKKGHRSDKFPVQIIIASQLIALLARDIFEYRVYFSDMLNNIAYNWVELNTNLERAVEYSTSATNRMYELLENIIDLPENRFDISRGITKQVKSEFDSIIQATAYYEERLANYLDTMAWAYYKLGNPSDLAVAQNILENEATKYGANNATIYYHLARLCITKIEQIWQSLPTNFRATKNIPSKKAHEITNLLRLSTLYWRQAMGLNRSGNLRARLSRVYERLISYRKEWEKIYQVNTNSSKNLDASREKQ